MSGMFLEAKEKWLDATLDINSSDIRVMLVRSTYTFDNTDEFITDLGAVDNGRSAALGSKTIANGLFDAADTTITATAAVACNKLIVFEHTGADATADLICCIDITEFTPSASQVCNIVWDAGANRIFQITN